MSTPAPSPPTGGASSRQATTRPSSSGTPRRAAARRRSRATATGSTPAPSRPTGGASSRQAATRPSGSGTPRQGARSPAFLRPTPSCPSPFTPPSHDWPAATARVSSLSSTCPGWSGAAPKAPPPDPYEAQPRLIERTSELRKSAAAGVACSHSGVADPRQVPRHLGVAHSEIRRRDCPRPRGPRGLESGRI